MRHTHTDTRADTHMPRVSVGLSTCLQTAPLSGPFDLNTEPALLSQSETGSLVIL